MVSQNEAAHVNYTLEYSQNEHTQIKRVEQPVPMQGILSTEGKGLYSCAVFNQLSN